MASHTHDARPASTSSDTLGADLNTARMIGGFVGSALSAYYTGRTAFNLARAAYTRVRQEVTYTVTIYADDELYTTVQEWLVGVLPAGRQRSLSALTRRPGSSGMALAEPVEVGTATSRRRERDLRFALDSSQSNAIRIRGHRINVLVERPDDIDGSDDRKRVWAMSKTKITFTAYSNSAREAVMDHLTELHQKRMRAENAPRFKLANRWGGWFDRSDLPPRALDTIVLPDGQLERLTGHLDRFFASEAEYVRTGTPFHTGILLTGPPGTGKTSIFRALADHFALDLYLLPLNDIEGDADLLRTVSEIPPGSLLLMEDADVFALAAERAEGKKSKKTKKSEGSGMSTTTLSGLLNSLDGIATPHGLIIGITSNFGDQLDSALVRPGRIDIVEEIGYLDDATARRLVELVTQRTWGDDTKIRAEDQVTPAALVNALRTIPDIYDALDSLR